MADLGSYLGEEEVILTSDFVLDLYEEMFVLRSGAVTHTHKVEGRIYDHEDNPIARKVCVFSKTTDQLLGSTVSDAATGFYSIAFSSSDPVYVVCFPNEDENMNAKIYDRVVPVPV